MSSGSVLRSKPVCIIPQRYVISIVVSVAATLSYGQFLYTETATRYMQPYSNKTTFNRTIHCGVELRRQFPVEISDTRFDWTPNDVELILNLYIYGFYLVQVPAGVVADKVGGKMVLNISVALLSILTLITPGVLRLIDGNTKITASFMFLMGFTGGAGFPAIFSVIATWSPKAERCRMASFTFATIQASFFFNWCFSDYLITKTDTWGTVFYLYGAIGVLWSFLWYFVGASRPSASKYIDENELNFLKNRAERHVTIQKKIPVWAMLKSLPIWAMCSLEVFHMAVLMGVVETLPAYIRDLLGWDRDQIHKVLALAAVVLIVSTVAFCWLSDFIVAGDYINITTTRRIFVTFGTMGPIVFLLTQTYTSTCNVVISAVVTSTVLIFIGSAFVGVEVNSFDLAPNFSGTLKGLLTALDILSFTLLQYLMDNYAPHRTPEEWKKVDWVMLYLSGAFSLVFMVFGTGEEQSWNMEDN